MWNRYSKAANLGSGGLLHDTLGCFSLDGLCLQAVIVSIACMDEGDLSLPLCVYPRKHLRLLHGWNAAYGTKIRATYVASPTSTLPTLKRELDTSMEQRDINDY